MLLDIRTSTLRLINGIDLKTSDGCYTALSYCWGNTMPETGKTTVETLEARRAGIEFTLLPKILREVIIVTRLLGIPLIWIDALCIIQGDVHDWEEESASSSLFPCSCDDCCHNLRNPLSRRGWTLQERELSTRTIPFHTHVYHMGMPTRMSLLPCHIEARASLC